MHYSSAVVLSTLAIGTAAAGHNRHASFHARRQADSKRSADNLDWNAVAYDLKEVDWNKVNWSSVFASPTAAAATTPAAAAPTYEAEQPKPEPTTTKEEVKPAPTSTKAAEPTKPAENIGDQIGDIVDDLMSGVSDLASRVGCKVGKNDKSDNGGIWIGKSSKWTAEFTNDGNGDAVLYCWKANGFTGMSVNVNVPDISVGLKSGKSVTLSFAEGIPAACAPAFSDTKLAMFGGWDQTWWEVTYGQWGAFDVSRNVNMNGNTISSKGSKCTSDMNTCVFKCRDGMTTCEKGTDYDLYNCGASNGGGGGYDTVMQGTGGGCSMGSSKEHINVSFS